MGEFEESIQKIVELDSNKLVRKELGIALDFKEAKPLIESMQEFWEPFTRVKEGVLDPNVMTNYINKYLNPFLVQIEVINQFNVAKIANPAEAKNNTITHLRAALNASIQEVGGLRAFITKDSSDFKDLEAKATAIIQNLDKIGSDAQTKSESIITNLSTAAGSLGVEVHSKSFKEEADKQNLYAKWWGAATVIVIVLFAILITWMFVWRADELVKAKDIYGLMPLIGFRLFIVSLSYLVIYECIKNFNIHRHLNTENRFREKALVTFRTFVDAANEDEDIKAAVLLAVTNVVFSAPITGYVSQNINLKANPPVFELARKTITPDGD